MEKKALRHFSMRAAMMLLVMMLTTATAWAENTMYVIAEEIGGTISISQNNENNNSSSFTANKIRLTFYYGERPSGYTEGSTVWSQRTASIGGSCIFDVPTSADTPAWYVSISKVDAARRQEAVVEVLFDPSFAAAKPTSTAYWFQYMENLRGLNLNDLDVSELTNARYMFYRCTNLKYIYCERNWDRSKLSISSSMFGKCTSLPGYNAHKVDKAKAKPQPDGYFTTIGLTYNTAGGYYEINDEQDLIDLGDFVGGCSANHCEGKTFKLTADLDFTNMPTRSVNGNSGNFHPIGLVEDASFDGCFSGHFDGQNHTIKGLSYTNKLASDTNNNEPVGLFKKVYGSSAVVERVLLIDPQMSGKLSSCGGIAGLIYNGATIRNCTMLGGSIVSNGGKSGGIVGSDGNGGATTIEGCTVIGTSVQDGMIIGYALSQNTIKDCIYYDPDGKGICETNYTDGGGNQRVYQVTLGENVTASGATYSHALLPGKAYYAEGATVSLDHDREGYVFLGYTTTGVTLSGSATSFTMPANDVTIGAEWADPADISVNAAGTEYTIHTAEGWNVFCDCLDDNDTYNRFSGKTVRLGADITVSRMAGSSYHDFTGTFDGDGHTLTFNYTTSEQYAAPFRNVESGCVIENLHISGAINTSAMFAAGLVGDQYGTVTIRNCRVSVTIQSTVSGDGTHAGLVARNHDDITIEGCVFDGRLLGSTTNKCGGFIGWRYKTATIRNSLFAPAEVTVLNDGSATFARGNAPTTTNTYYTRALGTAQGTAAYVYTPATASFVPANVGAESTGYSVSGITAYATGLKYDGKFYFEKAEVSLADNADNSSNVVDNQVADVTLTGRTLYKDGDWNTLCLPFAVNSFAGTPLEGATVKELDATQSSLAGNTLTLKFNTVDAIEAGKPYIVKWASGANIVNPVFQGVTISSTTPTAVVSNDGKVTFVGQYSPFSIVESGATGSNQGNKNEILLMTKGNKIGYSKNPRTLNCFRCHFYVPTNGGQQAHNIEVDFGEGEATSVASMEDGRSKMEDVYYTLDGRKLEGKPTAKGMYIVNGRKVIIK